MENSFKLPKDYFTRKQFPVIVENFPCKRTFFVSPKGVTKEAFALDTKKVILNIKPPKVF